MRKILLCLELLILPLLVAGCAEKGGLEAAVQAEKPTEAAAGPRSDPLSGAVEARPRESRWTAGIVEIPAQSDGVVILRAIRASRHERYDRVVFEFEGAALPGYHIEYVDSPVRHCGSGNVVPLAGRGWLLIRFSAARAHDDAGRSTVASRERQPGLPVLKEIKSICDFEATSSWVLGLSSPNRYRAMELSGPARLAVDIRH